MADLRRAALALGAATGVVYLATVVGVLLALAREHVRQGGRARAARPAPRPARLAAVLLGA